MMISCLGAMAGNLTAAGTSDFHGQIGCCGAAAAKSRKLGWIKLLVLIDPAKKNCYRFV
jgi:hypothetical protein